MWRPELDEDARTIALLAELEARGASSCPACERELCGHEFVIAVAIGFKDAPRCASCLAHAVERDRAGLLSWSWQYIRRHECFLAGWEWASRDEGVDAGPRPACLGAAVAAEESDSQPHAAGAAAPDAGEVELRTSYRGSVDDTWDAGDMSCGDLVLELRMRLREMAPGAVLEVRALDPGAPEDLPAWCNLTGHLLAAAAHPHYWIRRKDD